MNRPNRPSNSPRRLRSGQSVVEFSLVVSILFLMVVAIADFGRVYSSAVAVEAAAREAADYGSFHATYWQNDGVVNNRSITEAEIERRACTAAAGSHLEGYAESPGTVDHATCTNPTFDVELEPDDLAASCWDPVTEPPCVVHVTMEYDFDTLLALPPLPATIHIVRESRFQMQDLTPP